MNYVEGEFYTIKINGRDYYLEVANSPKLRAKGLMKRADIGNSDGMIFIYPINFFYPMWGLIDKNVGEKSLKVLHNNLIL